MRSRECDTLQGKLAAECIRLFQLALLKTGALDLFEEALAFVGLKIQMEECTSELARVVLVLLALDGLEQLFDPQQVI